MKSSLIEEYQKILKRTLLHFLVCIVAVAYLIAGGYLFLYFEKSKVANLFNSTNNLSAGFRCHSFKETGVPKEMTVPKSIMLAFTIVTTIGYGDTVPVTYSGKIFCIFYGFIGIPLILLVIANIGRFLSIAMNGIFIKLKRLLIKKNSNKIEEREEKSLPAVLLLFFYGIYLCLGALIVQTWDDQKSFLDGLYFSFISLTSIGFGDIVPPEGHLLITMLYVGFGLTLGTMAVDTLSTYLRKLHNFGAIVKNSANITIWFGGKAITVKDFICAIARQLGATDDMVNDLCNNLDQIVMNAIKQRMHKVTAPFIPKKELKEEFQVEEFYGAVKLIFLQGVSDGEVDFIDDEGNTE